MRKYTRAALALPAGVAAISLALSGCVSNTPEKADKAGETTKAGPINVEITDDGCKVASDSIPSGVVTFKISNKGSVPNEFEILAKDKLQIIAERENIGPGVNVDLTTQLPEGSYFTACKPNMVGALVGEAAFNVTKGEEVKVSADEAKLREDAVTNYTAYVKDQVAQLLGETEAFTKAYTSGNYDEARRLYPLARAHYERIEPTAEAFGIKEAGDLDAALDLRIQDIAKDAGKPVTSPDLLDEWTGWHRIEADLWSKNENFKFKSDADRKAAADNLLENTKALYNLVYNKQEGAEGKFKLTLSDVAKGATDLMEEVANGKISGEEETFSHTDLYDFQANVDGARVAYGNVKTLLEKKDPEMAKRIEESFNDVQKLLDKYKQGEAKEGMNFEDYSKVATVEKEAGEVPKDTEYTPAQRDLMDAVNALQEDLSKVSAKVL